MFSAHELNTIDRCYFSVYKATPIEVVLKSKNTRHFWKLLPASKKGYTLYHSHQGDGNYHVQCNSSSLQSAISTIKKHDSYQLTHRKPENNDFDYVPLLPDSYYFIF